tara:strand:- start:2579 stop:2899 length:321 start_codon:yes stop_codon:yes gene_type:complete
MDELNYSVVVIGECGGGNTYSGSGIDSSIGGSVSATTINATATSASTISDNERKVFGPYTPRSHSVAANKLQGRVSVGAYTPRVNWSGHSYAKLSGYSNPPDSYLE